MSLNRLTIADARDRLRKGEITAVELTDACLTAIEGAGALDVVEGRRRGQVQAELHARVRRVDVLPARTGRSRELLRQLGRGHPEPVRRARAGLHDQVVHAPSLSRPGFVVEPVMTGGALSWAGRHRTRHP